MSRTTWPALVAAGLTLATLPLHAEEPRYGLQLNAALPQGDLKHVQGSELGLGMGAHMTFDLKGGHLIRPRFDALYFPEANSYGYHRKNRDLSLGADYLYHFSKRPEGTYLIAGLGLHRWTTEQTWTDTLYRSFTLKDTQNKVGVALGIGYTFNRSFGAEMRYLNMVTKDGADKVESRRSTLELGITYRF